MNNVIRNILSLNVRGLKLSIEAKINRMAVNSPLAVVVKIIIANAFGQLTDEQMVM